MLLFKIYRCESGRYAFSCLVINTDRHKLKEYRLSILTHGTGFRTIRPAPVYGNSPTPNPGNHH